MTTLLRTLPRRLPVLLLAAAALAAAAPPPLWAAAQDKKFKILFSDKAEDAAPRASVLVRPTVLQKVFVYVQNTTPNDDEATVEVWAGGALLEGAVQTTPVKARGVAQVVFGKAAPGAAPAPPPPPPAAPPPGDKAAAAPKPQGPTLQEAPGALQVRVYDKEHKEALDTADLTVSRPAEYVTIDPKDISYNPKPEGGRKNRLTVRVQATDAFAGPKCRIDLVLRPDRIPGLIDTPRKDGARGGYLTQAGGSLVLTADNLEFQEGVERQNGLVYLTIDGWERAFTLSTTFPADVGQAGKPALVTTPLVRLDAAPVANPGAPYPVGLEADNAAGARAELGFDRGGGFSEANDEITWFPRRDRPPFDRQVLMLFGVAKPEGCLLLQPQVQDWKTELDTTNVFGPRTLRVRLIDNNKTVAFRDVRAETLKAAPAQPVTEILQTVTLDGSPPEGVKLVDFPEKLPRGADLPVKAVGDDPDSGIQSVVFYVGKPGPDGNPPPMAVKTPGKLIDKDKHLWAALLPAPTDVKGRFDVSVQFVNGANAPASDTVTIQLVDPTAPGALTPKGGSIEGLVFQGGQFVPGKDGALTLVDARPQPNIEVRLLDDKGAVKDAVKSNANGKYLFENVAAGSYKVTAAKTTDSTKGETAVQVLEGKKVVDVYVKLQR